MAYSQTFSPALGFIVVLLISYLVQRFRQRSYPPGPRGLPVIGNLFQVPTEHAWITFTQWRKTYGDIVHLSVLGRPIVVLNSRDAITALLEKKSALYSDRPFLPMASEMIGYSHYVSLEPYSNRHREGRKLILSTINQRTLPDHRQMQELKVLQFLSRLLTSPEQFRLHIRWVVASIVFQLTYGRNVESFDDDAVRLAERVTHDLSIAVKPGAFLVDTVPILRYIPSWFPGAGFKAKAKQMRQNLHRLRDEPYDAVKEQVANGTALPSFTNSLVETHPSPSDEYLYKTILTTFYGAGADTTVSSLASFFLMMMVYPEVQRNAQAELDAIVEFGCLPKLTDRPQLPYIDALIKEIYRWNPVTSLALPHRLMQADTYKGYHIPAGATIYANSWAVLHDPLLYPDPFNVIPERYIKSDEGLNPDPRSFAFGYGRRVCPGQLLADDMIFNVVTMVLATFNISKPLGTDGSPIEPEISYTGNILSHPIPFHCRITPRSREAERLIAIGLGAQQT